MNFNIEQHAAIIDILKKLYNDAKTGRQNIDDAVKEAIKEIQRNI